MARIVWGARGERVYETGVDRGVLYVGVNPGVAWSGLISVPETPTGGQPKPYYLDGIKYANISAAEEFAGVINAYSSPAEFGPCDGSVAIQNGLFITQQPRNSFGLSYRTLLGNDVEGSSHGYKIHIVYNALAAPSQRANATEAATVEPIRFGWAFSSRPPAISGYKPTAHLVIDTRTADPTALAEAEDILYGTEAEAPRLPTPDELIAIFTP